ncbi:MAG: type IV toxin-antitoxin system AbiEi family antitoxin domain-containing protein [Patescibacteria group bacterium]|nr:type IV toxin-antitoxin system AbiEi family antitoxin domain-containing protein [Patescibacteria group bacterium]
MNRINELIKSGQTIFHTTDLAVLWHISNRNTLYTATQRAVKQGVLARIYKGLYTTGSLFQLDPFLLGQKAWHDFTYLSTETVLVQAGIIFQSMPYITFVAATTKKLLILGQEYRFRQMAPQFLHNRMGIDQKDGLFVASPERAVADLLYYNPSAFLDNRSLPDWDKIRSIQQQVGFL